MPVKKLPRIAGVAPGKKPPGTTMSRSALKAWRARKAYTLETAAQAPGLSRRKVAYYENGEKPIPRFVALATEALKDQGRNSAA
jgi:DNA-binding XRE family transcriptional regulator